MFSECHEQRRCSRVSGRIITYRTEQTHCGRRTPLVSDLNGYDFVLSEDDFDLAAARKFGAPRDYSHHELRFPSARQVSDHRRESAADVP